MTKLPATYKDPTVSVSDTLVSKPLLLQGLSKLTPEASASQVKQFHWQSSYQEVQGQKADCQMQYTYLPCQERAKEVRMKASNDPITLPSCPSPCLQVEILSPWYLASPQALESGPGS